MNQFQNQIMDFNRISTLI